MPRIKSRASGRPRSPVLVDGGASESTTQSATVLLADDERSVREALGTWLASDRRWEVREAADGEEVLATIDDTVDVLVLDRRMPKYTGSEVLERLDETSFDGSVVVVSAYEPDERLAAEEVAGYLTKPVYRDQFFALLEQSLE